MDNKKLALTLLDADSEERVIALLKDAGYWEDDTAWRLLGDKDSNFSIVGNQQARPEAALVEKVVNSVDARLLDECLSKGIDPESSQAPRSIALAISVLFDGRGASTQHEGSIADWGNSKLLDQARQITLSVTGNKPRDGMPCITIADSGEGQSPGRFPDTFLSIDKANKLRIPFVQGKFNMGGTGVLKFCGKQSLQLIISRRSPRILDRWKGSNTKWESRDPRDGEWGFTIVRRERPTGATGDVRNSVFRYLAPISSDGNQNVLSFKSESLAIFPKDNQPYVREAPYGSVIKLYEYDVKGFGSHALRPDGLLSRLEVLLPHIALPVRLHECRSYRGDEARSFANNLVGLTVRLGENKNRADNLEPTFPASATFMVRGERFTAQIFAFKGNKADSYRSNEGIIFTINGQTHGAIPKTFFDRNKVKMGRLAKSIIVLVDCSHISAGAREDLFMNSRDRLSNGELRKDIESELQDIIGKHPGLRELRERRRSEEIASRLEESKPLIEILDSILKSSPTLSRLFQFGQRLNQPNRADLSSKPGGGTGDGSGTSTFHPRPHPTYFRFYKKRNSDVLRRNAEIGRRCRIRFETDVANDYFERDELPGSYEVEVIDGPLEGLSVDHNLSLHEGIANWSIHLPEDRLSVGDVLRVQCTVIDDTLPSPFVNIATITVAPADEQGGRGRVNRLKNTGGGSKGSAGSGGDGAGQSSRIPGASASGGISPPTPVRVERGDPNWVSHSFDDYTACVAVEDEEGFTFYINADNIYLRTEIKDSRSDVGVQEQKFIWGNILIGLALAHDSKARPNADEEDFSLADKIRETTRAIAPFLLPMIDHLGSLSESTVGSLATSGDED